MKNKNKWIPAVEVETENEGTFKNRNQGTK